MKIVLSNVPREFAEAIARTVVEEHLAACVNLIPVRSIYRWKDELTVDEEVTLLCKVSEERTPRLVERLQALHPFELPELIVLDVDVGESFAPYVDWVRRETSGEG